MEKESKYIKDDRQITAKYLSILKTWLINEDCAKSIFDGDYAANAWADFECFNSTTDREHLVMPNEIMLIDRQIDGVHWFVICKLSKNKDHPRIKHLHKVVEISKLKYWRAGYWLLPKFNKN